jgi:hypothetical protein
LTLVSILKEIFFVLPPFFILLFVLGTGARVLGVREAKLRAFRRVLRAVGLVIGDGDTAIGNGDFGADEVTVGDVMVGTVRESLGRAVRIILNVVCELIASKGWVKG